MLAPRETTPLYRALGRGMAGMEVWSRRHGAVNTRGLLWTLVTIIGVTLVVLLMMPSAQLPQWAALALPVLALIPLVIMVLLTAATVRVLWRDSPGRAWVVPQSEPPPDVKVAVAARIWRSTDTAELVAFLAAPADPDFRAQRAHEILGYLRSTPGRRHRAVISGRWWKDQVSSGWRRVPRGFVRDLLIAGTIIGVLIVVSVARHSVAQLVDGAAWVTLGVVLAAAVLTMAVGLMLQSARPLTRRGKIVRQHLEGLRRHLDQTIARERITATDPLLPYVVMFSDVREAQTVVARVLPYDGPLSRYQGGLTTLRFAFRCLVGVAGLGLVVLGFWVMATSKGALGYFLEPEFDPNLAVTIALSCALLALALDAIAIVIMSRGTKTLPSGWLRDLLILAPPVLAVTAFTMFLWIMARDAVVDGAPAIWAFGLSTLAIVSALLVTLALTGSTGARRRSATD